MIEHIVALLMFVGPNIKEHRIQIDPNTGKSSMSICMKHKREASRPPISENVSYKCIKSKAELELNIDGSKSIKALILE
tara:strand:+ start:418 stop:654 length:237 start_codon:yes stop_codon:yes gene_type:complete